MASDLDLAQKGIFSLLLLNKHFLLLSLSPFPIIVNTNRNKTKCANRNNMKKNIYSCVNTYSGSRPYQKVSSKVIVLNTKIWKTS